MSKPADKSCWGTGREPVPGIIGNIEFLEYMALARLGCSVMFRDYGLFCSRRSVLHCHQLLKQNRVRSRSAREKPPVLESCQHRVKVGCLILHVDLETGASSRIAPTLTVHARSVGASAGALLANSSLYMSSGQGSGGSLSCYLLPKVHQHLLHAVQHEGTEMFSSSWQGPQIGKRKSLPPNVRELRALHAESSTQCSDADSLHCPHSQMLPCTCRHDRTVTEAAHSRGLYFASPRQ